jgi:serine/threonine protein kinase
VNLLGTYKSINQLFFERKKQAAAALQECAGDKWCKISRGDVLRDDGKYRVIDALGKGTFGQVVRASVRAPAAPASSPAVPSSPPSTTPSGTVLPPVPTITSPEEADGFKLSHHHGDGGGTVAVKIVQGKASFYRQAQTEISILRQLNAADVHGHHVIRLQDAFMHGPHVCMVFPVLADSLYDLLLKTAFRGVSLHLVRKFGAQLLRSLQFIGSQGIVHTDLKPENVLLVHARRSGVRVIDFGSSCRESQSSTSSPAPCVYIQSRFYRSPEIMLGLPWGRPIDMWSLGCMLFELHEGRPLFNGND